MMSSSSKASPWIQPESAHPQTGLKVLNSLTKSKVPFVPREGNYVSWYGCGPTVYDSAHMGHACNYVTFDIIRRIMEDYLGYDMNVVMNITDIDDKVILRARQKHLLKEYSAKIEGLSEQLVGEVSLAFVEFINKQVGEFVEIKLGRKLTSESEWKEFATAIDFGKDPAFVASDLKAPMHYNTAKTTFEALAVARMKLKSGQAGKTEASALIAGAEDVLSQWLDRKYGTDVTDQRIFQDLASYWEKEFLDDMDALNVRRPHVMTRVSEFISEIVQFIQRIIDNGYAYEADGSVYFSVKEFDGKNGHFYAKLRPSAKGNTKLLADGEGSLGKEALGKRDQGDFALWKRSKPGEPRWASPWGEGRPGWHIECSVMASEILGQQIDIHTGGVDLEFPHHDNEMSQSEACFENHQWVNYFMHSGHLHIEGQKMSKSLKNFITIKEVLKKYTARQIRMLFLFSQWSAPLYFDSESMEEAVAVEKLLSNFFTNATAILRDARERPAEKEPRRRTLAPELELLEALKDTQAQVHQALLDSFDTPTAMRAIQDIVSRTNIYLQRGRDRIDPQVIQAVAEYVTRIMRVFGMANESPAHAVGWGPSSSSESSQGAADRESTLLPVARVLSDFRDAVRELALSGGDKQSLLKLCDKLRDQDLPSLGIVIDDHGDGRALVKIADPEELQRERERQEAKAAELLEIKQRKAQEAEEKRQARIAKSKQPPQEMFRTPEMRELYSEWDERGIPTKDKAGEELTKSKLKKLAKEYEAQKKLYEKYIQSQEAYLQYSSIAARALRRVVKPELQNEIAKREGMHIKVAKWENGKSGASAPASTIETRAKAEH
ncbi:cysteinyl-tRNA synthetase [Coemansia sp. RSA 989]|nr:cysteinyl-tRNA synthetase [Coemansia sp. RSA 989]KAJ2668209.1 cysteinyl-tRNA synthetase [Coemansia sp. RSA 1085]